MTERRKLAVFAVVVVLTAFPLAILLIRATHRQRPWSREHPVYRVHRQKISETVSRLEHETPEQLVEGLREESNYTYPGVRSPDFAPQNHFELVLSSRRTLKLLAELSGFPSDDARQRAEQISQEMLAQHQGAIRRALDRIEKPSAPENTQSIWSAQLAHCCGLLLLARFSNARTVLEHIRKTQEFSRECSARISQSSAYPEFFLRSVKQTFEPDNAFKLNVLVYAIGCDGSIAARDKESLRKQLALLPKRELTLSTWDAATTEYEARHILGAKAETSKGATTITFHEWPGTYDEARQNELIESVAEFILTHSR